MIMSYETNDVFSAARCTQSNVPKNHTRLVQNKSLQLMRLSQQFQYDRSRKSAQFRRRFLLKWLQTASCL